MSGLLRLAVCCAMALVCASGLFAQTILEHSADSFDVVKRPPSKTQSKQAETSSTVNKHAPVTVKQLPSDLHLLKPVPQVQAPEVDGSAVAQDGIASQPQVKPSGRANKPQRRPDEGVLWRLYKSHQYSALESKIKLFQNRYPGWKVPKKLLGWMAVSRNKRFLKQAYVSKSWNALIAFAGRNPDYFDCDHVDAIWMLAEAYARTNQVESSVNQYQTILGHCHNDAEKIATLQKAAQHLPVGAMDPLWLSAAQVVESPQRLGRLRQIRYDYDKQQFLKAYQRDSRAISQQQLNRYVVGVEANQDAVAANLLGWYFLNNQREQAAIVWFTKSDLWKPGVEEASYGLALALRSSGDLVGAEQTLRKPSASSERGKALLGQILVQRAWSAVEAQYYDQARVLASEALDYLDSRRQAKTVLAWVDYHQNNFQQAAASFEQLYRDSPDQDLARGWALSLAATERGRLPELAEQYSVGAIRQQINKRFGQEMYWRKHFLAAHDRVQDEFPRLDNIDSPWLSAGALYRYKSGNKGLNRLDTTFIPIIDGVTIHNRVHRFGLRFDSMYLDSKTPPACAPIGSLPLQLSCSTRNVSVVHSPGTITVNSGRPLRQELTTQLHSGQSFELSYARDGWTTPYIRLGITPIGGVVSPRPTLQVGFSKEFAQGRWGTEIYSLPVRESILSYTGLRDPYSDRKWGRVLRSGAKLPLLLNLDNRWTLTGLIDFAALYGEAVKTNWTAVASVGAGYDFRLSGFDYFSVGPEVSFQHFDQNQNHFTLGHGGYFSPEHFLTTGVGVHFLTDEGRSFVLQGRIAVGYQNFREAAAPWFPRDGAVQNSAAIQATLDGRPVFSGAPFYRSNSQDGFAHDFEFKGVWLAHPHIQIGGGIAARRTSGYDDYSSGLFVRFLFESRKASFSSDIRDYLFQKFY